MAKKLAHFGLFHVLPQWLLLPLVHLIVQNWETKLSEKREGLYQKAKESRVSFFVFRILHNRFLKKT
jgi:hypothetical protein